MSVIELFLVLVRRTVEIHGMYSFAVVEVYVSCYGLFEISLRTIDSSVELFQFKRFEERFHDGVVIWIAGS